MKRKTFVKNMCMMALGGSVASGILSACSTMARITGNGVEGELKADGLHLPLSAFHQSNKLQYVIVHHENLKFPVCVYKYPNEDYEALWMECTHQGAELQVFGNKLECPAHGSEFNQKGEVESGPADTNLKTFKTRISGKHLVIQLT